MAKDYIQDIVPPGEPERKLPIRQIQTNTENSNATTQPESSQFDDSDEDTIAAEQLPERSIRNISPPRPRSRPGEGDIRDIPPPTVSAVNGTPYAPRRKSRPKWVLWSVAAISIVILGILALFVFRNTTVTITPRAHTIVFDQNAHFTAYPAADAATGTLTYTVQSSDIEDSEVVPSKGTQHVESRASGSITVINDFSTSLRF